MTAPSRARGFTLIEVLVATMVIAVALGAIMHSTSLAVANLTYLRDKTFAHWVASNEMAKLLATGEYPATGRQRGKEEMAGQEWHWTREVKATPDKDMRRVEIRVRDKAGDDTGSLAVLTGFVTRFGASTSATR
ncbi:MAG: type II secretion system minor pseudopilin GspI [Pseudomonadota bacterium]|nr:type II secretion system minor pseudopilin GspI [Pseudomonadota bacterium]